MKKKNATTTTTAPNMIEVLADLSHWGVTFAVALGAGFEAANAKIREIHAAAKAERENRK